MLGLLQRIVDLHSSFSCHIACCPKVPVAEAELVEESVEVSEVTAAEEEEEEEETSRWPQVAREGDGRPQVASEGRSRREASAEPALPHLLQRTPSAASEAAAEAAAAAGGCGSCYACCGCCGAACGGCKGMSLAELCYALQAAPALPPKLPGTGGVSLVKQQRAAALPPGAFGKRCALPGPGTTPCFGARGAAAATSGQAPSVDTPQFGGRSTALHELPTPTSEQSAAEADLAAAQFPDERHLKPLYTVAMYCGP